MTSLKGVVMQRNNEVPCKKRELFCIIALFILRYTVINFVMNHSSIFEAGCKTAQFSCCKYSQVLHAFEWMLTC